MNQQNGYVGYCISDYVYTVAFTANPYKYHYRFHSMCLKFLLYLICYIIGLLPFFQKLCCHHLVLIDLFLMSLCTLLIHLLVIISNMVIFTLKVSVSLILIFGSIIRQIRCYHGLHSPYESLIEFFHATSLY